MKEDTVVNSLCFLFALYIPDLELRELGNGNKAALPKAWSL